MRGRYKKWAAPYLSAHPEIAISSWDPADPFFAVPPLYLEVGAGKGDFVLTMAVAHPGHYLALERDISVCGILGKKVAESGLTNIKVAALDFDVASENLRPYAFDAIYLNFSDPWPKKKHWKRRLTVSSRLLVMMSLLKDGGFIIFKSDNEILYEFTKEEALKTPLSLLEDQPDYLFDEKSDAMSEYEQNFRAMGAPIHRLVYQKRKKE